MKSHLTYNCLIVAVILLSSCSAAYKMGQTPDDVYYSPAPPQDDGYVTSYTEEDQNSYGYNQDVEDLAIRRGISDPVYRSSLSLGYDDLGDGYGNPYFDPYGWYSPYTSFYPYGYFGPYATGIGFYSGYYPFYGGFYPGYSFYPPLYSYGKTQTGGLYGVTPRRVNLDAYRPATTRTPVVTGGTNMNPAPVRTFTPQQRPPSSGFGGFVRRVFTPAGNSGVSNDRSGSERTFRPSVTAPVSGGNSGGSSGGGGGSVRTFRH